MLQASDAVFLGTLVEKDSFVSGDGRLIWTRHLFAVEETIRGTGADTVEVFELGGTVGDISLRVSHGVSYEPGRSYLIFARRDVEGRLQTWGGPEGGLPVLEDGAGRRVVRVRVGSPLSSLRLDGQARAFYTLDEVRSGLRELGPPSEEKR